MAGLRIADPAFWGRLRTGLAPLTKSPAMVKDWLVGAGAASTADDIGCSREALLSTVLHMHEIRKRFTVVDLAWLVGILPDAADEIVDQWLIA